MDSHVDLLQVAKETDGFSGSDLKEMCRDAALLCVREYVNNACEEDVYVGPAARSQLLLVLPGELGMGRGSHRAGASSFPAPLPLYTETPHNSVTVTPFGSENKSGCPKVPKLEVA